MNNHHRFGSNRWAASAAAFFGLLLLLTAGTCIGASEEAVKTSLPPITSASEIDYPPFCFIDAKGRATGFSVELMRAALAAMGRDVTFRIGPWNEVRGWLERGEVEALPLVGRTPEREFLVDFTFPYMSLHGAIVVRDGTKDIWDLGDLRGRKVGVMKGDNAEEFLRREERGIDIHTTATFEDALRDLSEGRYDAVVIQRLVALRLIQETGLTNLRIVNKPIEGFRQDFCFAVKKGDHKTLALLNEGLALVMADGTYRSLHARWFAALELPANRRIVVGGDHNFPPFEYLDKNGRPAGYNVELTRAIGQELGIDIEVRLGPWAEIRQALARGEIDVLQGMFYSAERNRQFDFTPAHTEVQYVGVTRRDGGLPPATAGDLTGKRIVVQQGDIMHDYVLEHNLAEQVSTVDAQENALRELAEGKCDCALVSRQSALYWIKQMGWNNLVVGQHPLLTLDYCYAVLKGQKALLATFSEGLRVIEENGEYRRIREKWLGVHKDQPLSLISALRYSAMVLVPLVVVVLGFSLWSWSLRRQVARRTEQLNAFAKRHEAMLEAIPDIVMEVDEDKVYAWANAAGLEFFGEDVLGKEAADYFIGEQDTYALVQPLFNGDENVVYVESRQRRRDGQERLLAWWCRVLKDKSGRPVGGISSARDITEQKLAEDALRDEAMRRRILTNQSRDGIVVLDEHGKVYEANQRFCDMLGYSAEEILQLHVWDWDARWSREELQGMVAAVGVSGDFFETSHRRKDGTCFAVEISSTGAVIAGKKLISCVCRDISERKQAELRIEHLNRVLRAIRDVNELIVRERDRGRLIREGSRLLVGNRGYLAALIVLTDADDRPVLWAGEGMGAAFEPINALLELGEPPPCCIHVRATEKVLLVDDRLALCGQCPISGECAESDSLCARLAHDGEAFGYLAVAVAHGLGADPEEQGLFTEMVEDFSYALHVAKMAETREKSEQERQILQEQLNQSRKMEFVGRLAGGVAHDYNNMLGVIIGFTEMAMGKVARDDSLHADLTQILKAARRSADLTRQLLAFARKQTIAPRLLDLNETVESMLKMLRRLIGEDIDLAWLPASELGLVKMDPAQIDQVLANLCVNARDAISGIGKVTIETQNVAIDKAYCARHVDALPGDYVLLAVSDDGCGMDAEMIEQIFEPFFTTKEVGQGTGLGLATVYGIARQNGGFINVYSEPGKGSVFKIYLPRQPGESEEVRKEKFEEIPQGRGELVLLVEDEAAMLRMGQMMLERLGYRVLTANRPSQAMRLAGDHSGEIDLLITDVVMPEMSGRELTRQVHAVHPRLKVMYMSGYTANAIVHRGELEPGVHFIQKPFSMKDLAAGVRKVLDGIDES